jgi:hypothetical protein
MVVVVGGEFGSSTQRRQQRRMRTVLVHDVIQGVVWCVGCAVLGYRIFRSSMGLLPRW